MAPLTDPEQLLGLSAAEVVRRLREFGPNELPGQEHRSLIGIALEILREPIFLLLLACGLIYFALGDLQEAWILLAFVLFITGIELVQDWRTERSLAALRDLASPRALVIRDGQRLRIAGREVVPGDLMVLAEGDRVAADARLVWSTHLSADESLLTGESIPVRKQCLQQPSPPLPQPGAEAATGWVYAGSLIVQGQGIAEVQATGAETAMGRIGLALETIAVEDTHLQQQSREWVMQLTGVAIAICVCVVLLYGLQRRNWLQGLLAGLALAMGILPNEVPVVLAIFLALGAWRFARQGVLTRRLPVVETLGSTTVLCVDKTGTLTENRMAVQQLCGIDQGQPWIHDLAAHPDEALPEAVHALVEYGILASRRDPFDPMELALRSLGARYLDGTEHLHASWQMEREYPLSPELLAMSCVWRTEDDDLEIAAKGAPEAIADLCHFSPEQWSQLLPLVEAMARQGLRVLGVCRGQHRWGVADGHLPPHQHDFDFSFVGLIGLADPLRPSVPEAIADCRSAGVRVVMITGDHPETARRIAEAAGLGDGGQITGSELEAMDDPSLDRVIGSVAVIARVAPEQKLRIVRALQRRGEVVAMTGDGVNDAPALKAAQVGIAMGERGTDVAREAADLVLLRDDFSAMVTAIALGRRVFDNLRQGLVYTLAVHLPIAGLTLLPVAFGWPLLLLPIHIACLHLIIDPACTVVFEAEPAQPGTMQRPPRQPDAPLFDRRTWTMAIAQGMTVLLVLLGMFAFAHYGLGRPEDEARALLFTTLLLTNLVLILVNRSWQRSTWSSLRIPNPALWWVLLGGLGFIGLSLAFAPMRLLFRFAPLHPPDLLLCAAIALVCLGGFELLKLWQQQRLTARG